MSKLISIIANTMKCPISPSSIRFFVFLHDLLMIPLAWALAYALRFNLEPVPLVFVQKAVTVIPFIILIQALYYWLFGLYRGVWRFASLPDLVRIIKVVIVGTVSSALILFLSAQLIGIPRSIFPLYTLLLIVLLSGSRVLYRGLKSYVQKKAHVGQIQRVLIIGAGQAGEGLARDLARQKQNIYQVIGFVDDSATKQGQEIHAIRVLGKIEDIPALTQEFTIDLLIIAIPSASSAQMRCVVEYCEKSNVPFRTLPSLRDLASGHVQIDTLREVSLEDLLGREPVLLDWQKIRAHIQDKTILISGGGGSIGSELCRQIATLSPKHLIVVEQNEFNLYALTLEIEKKFPSLQFTGHLLDVTDRVGIRTVLEKTKVEIVFHAAAYKHVPLLETQLRIAVKNNIFGTKVLAEESAKAQVEKFVLISTDKAVNPTNIMGASKRVAELFCQNYGLHSQTQFITVRFGNVLGSMGSVVPLFKKQIEAGGPVTVTHPEITRFFMTIPEASQLILQALVMGTGGEIFVLDMGEPIKIQYLAEQMIRLAGLAPQRDIVIQYTGLRPGEKLYEELFHIGESLSVTSHEKIMQANYRKADWQMLLTCLENMEIECEKNNEAMLRLNLKQLVPEYL